MNTIIAIILLATSFVEKPDDRLAAMRPVKDAEGNNCALIRVVADVNELKFLSPDIVRSGRHSGNEYRIYISPKAQTIKIFSESSEPVQYNFPTKLKSGITYLMSLKKDISQTEKVITSETSDSRMVLVKGGSFFMGSGEDERTMPVREVEVSDFYMSKYEVTQAEWLKYMPNENFEKGEGENRPVYNISWYAAVRYCNLRSISEGFNPCYMINDSYDPAFWGYVPSSGDIYWNAVKCDFKSDGYRLPTESEWEYAARGGNLKNSYIYSGSNRVSTVAWYGYDQKYGKSKGTGECYEVGKKKPNGLDIYDMSGNVWEWCWDWFDIYSNSDLADPTGPEKGKTRILRGGDWSGSSGMCGVAGRSYGSPFGKKNTIGFRVVRSLSE